MLYALEQQDPGVATAHWEHEAHVRAVAEIRQGVRGFAQLHGMDEEGCRNVAVAVSEAVTNSVRHAYPAGTSGPVAVDAATDGTYLSVRVTDRGTGGAGTSLGLGMPLMAELSDRIEMGPGRNGLGTAVLLEFTICESAAGAFATARA